MKYVVAMLVGALTGALFFGLLLYVNPMAKGKTISPLAVTQNSQLELSYHAVPEETLAWINDGQSVVKPTPERVQDIWEPTIENTEILVSTLQDSRGNAVGVGVKFATTSDQPGLMRGDLPVHSVWHMWLTDRGGLLIDQSENRWPLLREVVLPAHLSSANSWRGSWFGILTSGPGALGTARLTGGSGEFAASNGEAVEALNARAYSADSGPVAMEGRLTLSITGMAASAGNAR